MTPVEGIDPVDGWVLMWMEYDHGHERYPTPWYEAHHPELGTRLFQTSGYSFHPTQDRFAWLLEHGTVQRKVPSAIGWNGEIGVPWCDEAIDRAILESARE